MKLSKAKSGQTTTKLKSNTRLGGFFRIPWGGRTDNKINGGESMCLKYGYPRGRRQNFSRGPFQKKPCLIRKTSA